MGSRRRCREGQGRTIDGFALATIGYKDSCPGADAEKTREKGPLMVCFKPLLDTRTALQEKMQRRPGKKTRLKNTL